MLFETLFSTLQQIVREAGELIRPLHGAENICSKEGSSNFVTKYDSMVQDFLIRKLSKILPAASFIGEENNCSDTISPTGYTFIIDPIDGTTNFMCDFRLSAICVGLAFNNTLEMGIVYNPFTDELFAGWRNHGAYLNKKKLQISNRHLSEGTLCIDISPYDESLRNAAFERARILSYHCTDIRCIGSAALSICYIACGRSTGYISSKLCIWDYSAALVILTEAGGVLTDEKGQPVFPARISSVRAGTPASLADISHLLLEQNESM